MIIKSSTTRLAVLAASLMMVLAAISAQDASAQITLSINGVSVKDAMEHVQKDYNYSFLVNTDSIDIMRKVTVNANDASIENVISQIFAGQDIIWSISGNNITIAPKAKPIASPASDSKKTYSGTVVDENNVPVIGAAVYEEETGAYCITGIDGEFSVTTTAKEPSFTFSCIGYKTIVKSVAYGAEGPISVTMPSEAIALDEALVIGYGVQNRRDVTTSIASVKDEDLKASSSADFREAMAAKMPGVQVINLGGQPEGNVSVRIRGIQSATSGNDPLYIIDGIQSDSRAFSNLDVLEIESIEVLKDASAAAIYGSRGSCGVVLVTTKRGGKEDRPVVRYDGQFSVSTVSKKYDLLSAYELAQLYKESRDGSYLYNVPTGTISDPYSTRPQTYHMVPDVLLPYLNGEEGLTDTDWQDEVLRTALAHKHSISVSGKGKSNSYFISGNYLKREGVVIGSDFERFGIRANMDGNRGRFKYGLSFSPSYSKTNHINSDSQYGSGDGVIASMLMAMPWYSPYNEDGSYNWDMNGTPLRSATVEGLTGKDTQSNAVLNPVALALEIKDVRENISLMGNVYAGYEFIKGLEYKLTLGGDVVAYERNYYRPSTLPMPGNWKYNYESYTPTSTNQKTNYLHWTISNQFSFNRTFGDHKINAVAVYEAEQRSTSNTYITATGTAGDDKITTTFGKTVSPETHIMIIRHILSPHGSSGPSTHTRAATLHPPR